MNCISWLKSLLNHLLNLVDSSQLVGRFLLQKPVRRVWYWYFICTWECGAKIEIGFITRYHDGFNAKANLTINNAAVTRCYVWRSSTLDWTAVHACSTLAFILSKQLREINFIMHFLVFPLMCCFKEFNTKVITGYASLFYAMCLTIALQLDTLSLISITQFDYKSKKSKNTLQIQHNYSKNDYIPELFTVNSCCWSEYLVNHKVWYISYVPQFEPLIWGVKVFHMHMYVLLVILGWAYVVWSLPLATHI